MAQISPRAGTSLISCSPGQGSKLTAGGYCQLHLSQCWSAGYQGNQAWPTQDGSLNTSPAGRRTLRPYQTIKRIGVLDPAEPGGSFLGRQALESEGRPQQRPGPVRAIGPCRRASSRLCLAAARLIISRPGFFSWPVPLHKTQLTPVYTLNDSRASTFLVGGGSDGAGDHWAQQSWIAVWA